MIPQKTYPTTRTQPSGLITLKRHVLLGKYRLEKRLGIGGFCEVWQAYDTVEGIRVALKIPLEDVDGRRDNHSILREVQLVAQLRHPHIMPVKNADIINGHAVLATPLSVGTLDDRSRPMVPRNIIQIVLQVLDALAYAHSKRLIHCDVTPGNIFLFPDGRAALGDFGIGLLSKGRMETIDDFGTPGYVAPEQAYGRPTFRSDCFSVGLILYEFLTGYLPRWPFHWPFRANQRLRDKTNPGMMHFIKRALAVDPAHRFLNATQMGSALMTAAEKILKNGKTTPAKSKLPDWRLLRRQSFIKRYSRVLPSTFACVSCADPVAEAMKVCPWCNSDRNHFDTQTPLNHYCPSCRRGVLPEWHYCPWCYGPGFASPSEKHTSRVRYHDKCRHCKGKLMHFMRYCPWCHRKVRKPWRIDPFPELCGHCGWSVDSNFWSYCPWCANRLMT